MKRRWFLSWMGLGFLASSLPLAVAACSPGETTASDAATEGAEANGASPEASADAAGGFVALGSVADLDQKGSLTGSVNGKSVVVVRSPQNASAVFALDRACTHRGCDVEWKADQKQLVCPCHNSIFAPNGQVTQGPATRPLPTYTAKIEGDQVLVQV